MSKVLIIDDEASYRDYLGRYLVREGYDVQCAATASDALETCKTFAPDVVLADWMLRNHMHGLDVGHALREIHPGLRILLMTGFPSEKIREEAGSADVAHFLEKPFGLEELKAAIEDTLAEDSDAD